MNIFIKPKTNKVKVRKPDGQWLKNDGETLKRTAFWIRRINDGDVVVVSKDASTQQATATQVTTAKVKIDGSAKPKKESN